MGSTATAIDHKNILESLKWRYAVKKYDPAKKISAEDWKTLEEAMLLAPSSLGLQPYKLIVVTDPDVRERLKAASYGQTQITDASHLVVFAYKRTLTEADGNALIERTAEVRGVSKEALGDFHQSVQGAITRAVDGGFVDIWNSRQAYIALGFLIETAAMLGIDATPMEGFVAESYNEILGLDEYSAVAIATLGYRDAENDWLAPLAKVRKDPADLIVRV